MPPLLPEIWDRIASFSTIQTFLSLQTTCKSFRHIRLPTSLVRDLIETRTVYRYPRILKQILSLSRFSQFKKNLFAHHAISRGFFGAARIIVQLKEIHWEEAQNCLALICEACLDDLDFYEMLLQKTTPNFWVSEDKTLIEFAISHANYGLVKLLINDPRFDPLFGNIDALASLFHVMPSEMVSLCMKYPQLDPSLGDNELLRRCAQCGLIDCFNYLLDDPRVDPSSRENLVLWQAIENKNVAMVRSLMNHERVNPFSSRRSCFSLALQSSERRIAAMFLDHPKFDSAVIDRHLFLEASSCGDVGFVSDTIHNIGIDQDLLQKAFSSAISAGHKDVATVILEKGKVDVFSSHSNLLPLCCTLGYVDILRMSLSRSGSAAYLASHGDCLYSNAIQSNQISVVEFLLEDQRASPESIMHLAAEKTDTWIMSLLLRDPRVKPEFHSNLALSTAIQKKNLAAVELLLKDSRVLSNKSVKALFLALETKDVPIIKTFITRVSSWFTRTEIIKVFTAACRYGTESLCCEFNESNCSNLLEMLLETPGIKQGCPQIEIMCAIENGCACAVEYLLQQPGIDARALDVIVWDSILRLSRPDLVKIFLADKRFSPPSDSLFMALNNYRTETVRALVESGKVPLKYPRSRIIQRRTVSCALEHAVLMNDRVSVDVLLRDPRTDPNQDNGRALIYAISESYSCIFEKMLLNAETDGLEAPMLTEALLRRHSDVLEILVTKSSFDLERGLSELFPMPFSCRMLEHLIQLSIPLLKDTRVLHSLAFRFLELGHLQQFKVFLSKGYIEQLECHELATAKGLIGILELMKLHWDQLETEDCGR